MNAITLSYAIIYTMGLEKAIVIISEYPSSAMAKFSISPK